MERALDLAETEEAARSADAPEIRFSIVIASGPVNFGNVGVPDRLAFTAISEVVNTVTRLDDLTKRLGRSALVTEEIAAADPGRWQPLGPQPPPEINRAIRHYARACTRDAFDNAELTARGGGRGLFQADGIAFRVSTGWRPIHLAAPCDGPASPPVQGHARGPRTGRLQDRSRSRPWPVVVAVEPTLNRPVWDRRGIGRPVDVPRAPRCGTAKAVDRVPRHRRRQRHLSGVGRPSRGPPHHAPSLADPTPPVQSRA